MKLKTEYRVIYGDTDQMGVVYNANYLKMFERGRNEFFRQLNFSYRKLEKNHDILLPVVESYCKYLKGARYDDLLEIITEVVSLNPVKIKFEYEIRRESEIVAEGYTLHVFMKNNKIHRLDKDVYNNLKNLISNQK
ncbi:MAG: acyl-CoA thioesterase [Candidatus Mcinerneyibacterium aminivorans]|jgi:acyl-CoA thioester hydrolase|uniref:Acyl-CoA thioesterase n=1 Tax=Candidatus Mcinerneyibacterium aminivorans TaxID=2703815 RepID=A0A5D0MHH4_9BACT|nr:MAG: acyl-CoA thioesterase [Candidatus Mcinerneyibacterium aminivorans]